MTDVVRGPPSRAPGKPFYELLSVWIDCYFKADESQCSYLRLEMQPHNTKSWYEANCGLCVHCFVFGGSSLNMC